MLFFRRQVKMYKTLKITHHHKIKFVTIHRSQHRNSMNEQFLIDLKEILFEAEKDPDCRVVALQGEGAYFCTGMDFEEMTNNLNSGADKVFSEQYMSVLKAFTTTPKIIVSLLDGQVLAGGVGIVAASDLVFSTLQSQFGLSEALWGLLPACVTPFLIRRVGFQKAYRMTLTTETISAEKAYQMGLVDELTTDLSESMRRLLLRLSCLEEETIQDLKNYFRKMWIIDEMMEKTAITEITRLIHKPSVQKNIKNFMEDQIFPWEKKENLRV